MIMLGNNGHKIKSYLMDVKCNFVIFVLSNGNICLHPTI